MSSEKMRAETAARDDESGPRVVDDDVDRRRGREFLDSLTAHLPRRQATPEELAIFAEGKRRIEAGAPLLTLDERAARRRAAAK